MSVATYTFLPWVRSGLARAIAATDEPGAELAASVALPVTLEVDGAGEVRMDVRLYGPGDVTGLDGRQIVRTDPRPDATTAEDGYLAAVDFARADLPWLFTPAGASGSGRLRPWLALVVVRRQQGVRIDPSPGGPLPVLEIAAPARAAAELPDLSQSWAWAHAQIGGGAAAGEIDGVLRAGQARAGSRLLSPRRLRPTTAYLACVVPAFAQGVAAGLGHPVDETTLAPAWTLDHLPEPLRLPVYYSWQFATGPAGSFETLVRRIRPRPLPVEATQPVPIDIGRPGGGMPELDGAVVGLESVLRLPGPDAPPAWPDETRVPFQQALQGILDTPPDTTLAPPLYGRAQADSADRGWLRELNLDPRLRVAAAAGARVVQARQEELMATAWEQAGAARVTNTALRQAQLARELGGVLLERHFEPLAPAELLAVTAPAHARIAGAPNGPQTLAAQLRGSRVPEAVVSGAFRRLASVQGTLLRRTSPDSTRAPLDVLPALDRMAVAPATPAPTGMVALAGAAAPSPRDPDDRPAFAPDAVQARLLHTLRPEATVVQRAQAVVDAPAGTWDRPDPLAPLALEPSFPQPMLDGLAEVAPELLLPGIGHVPPETVALLETTPRVVEAYMVGLNHELSRELLWREFPAALSGTWFRRFWDRDTDDIPPIAEWGEVALGGHLRGGHGDELVLLVRGELLRRYPTTSVYAAPATADGGLDATKRLAPTFSGRIDPDVSFVGFALSEEDATGAPGWYFVFEQHPGEPRFGLDDVAQTPTPSKPDDLAWSHVPLTPSGDLDVGRPLAVGSPDLQAAWGKDAATMVSLLLQKPVRVAIHASVLLSVEEGR